MLRNRRKFLLQATALGASPLLANAEADEKKKAQIVITYDLEMSRHYPKRGITEWDYQKGNLESLFKTGSAASAGQQVFYIDFRNRARNAQSFYSPAAISHCQE